MALNLSAGRNRRVRTPTVIQMDAVECGAAALGIILGYYGRIVPLEKLREQCGISRDGSKANHMVDVARQYGLDSEGLRSQPELLKDKTLPLIVFWNFNHYVVVEGFGRDKVYINDPASGPRVISEEEFDLGFTGVVLTFELTDSFKKGGSYPSALDALRKRVRGSEIGVLFILIVSLGLVIPGFMVPVLTQIFVDDVLIRGRVDVQIISAGLVAVALVIGLLTWLQQKYLLRLDTKLAMTGSSKFLWHILHLPTTFFAQRYPGDIITRLQINDRIARILSLDLATNLLGIVLAIFYGVLMIRYDIWLALIGFSIACLNIVALNYFSRKRKDINQRLLQDRGKMAGVTMNGLQMIETLKSTGSESDFFAEWGGYFAKSLNAQQSLSWTSKQLLMVPALLTALNTTAILVIGSYRIIDGAITLGMIIAFQALVGRFLSPVNNLVNLGATLQEVDGDLKRLDDVLNNESILQHDPVEDITTTKLRGYLDIHNLSFGYSALEPPLIVDFNLSLKPGQRVALVGASGSGKSTLAKLIAGLYEPWGGDILFDGRPASELARRVVSNSVALVDQDILLLEGSIRDNLTLWDRTIPEEQISRAARDASIDATIAKRGGFESIVGENGRNFSGGERQRLEIARALAIDPTILILDEATSALDPITEKNISDSLRRRGCTTVIVAHRLSTIRDADEIIVLDRGQTVQRGTHDELIDTPGVYRDLINTEAVDTSDDPLQDIWNRLR